MFRCERCGTGFNPTVAATLACCPRCRARDGVSAVVSFSLFGPPGRNRGSVSGREEEAGSSSVERLRPASAEPPSQGADRHVEAQASS
jgi:hypothetical protein